jgi:hypothetical protein
MEDCPDIADPSDPVLEAEAAQSRAFFTSTARNTPNDLVDAGVLSAISDLPQSSDDGGDLSVPDYCRSIGWSNKTRASFGWRLPLIRSRRRRWP